MHRRSPNLKNYKEGDGTTLTPSKRKSDVLDTSGDSTGLSPKRTYGTQDPKHNIHNSAPKGELKPPSDRGVYQRKKANLTSDENRPGSTSSSRKPGEHVEISREFPKTKTTSLSAVTQLPTSVPQNEKKMTPATPTTEEALREMKAMYEREIAELRQQLAQAIDNSWQRPGKTSPRKKNKKYDNSHAPNFATQNKFNVRSSRGPVDDSQNNTVTKKAAADALAPEMTSEAAQGTCSSQMEWQPATTSSQNGNSTNQQSRQQSNGSSNNISKGKKGKYAAPPITVRTSNIKTIVSRITPVIGKSNFVIKKVNDEESSIKTVDGDCFDITLGILKQHKIENYTYTPKSEKVISLLLKGMSDVYDEKEVTEEIELLKLDNIQIKKVKKIDTRSFFRSDRGGPAFLVQLMGTSTPGNLTKIKLFANHVVRWEKITRRESIQCYKCQRLGHVAGRCEMDYRCVKCPGNHLPGECPIDNKGEKKNANEIYCANCKAYGHTANYRGCPYIKESREKMRKRIELLKQKKLAKYQSINNFVQPSVRYSQVVQEGMGRQMAQQGPFTQKKQQNDDTTAQDLAKIEQSIKQFIAEKFKELENTIKSNSDRIEFIEKEFLLTEELN